MNWRDLLYFSKGERRALALLLCLITISWILLLWTNTKRMPIEAQTDAHRTENRQAPGERRIITGKNTSEGGKNFIRKESGPHPNKTKNTLKDKSPTLTGNNSYPTGKKRKGYTLYTRTEKYAPGTLVARRIMKYRELLGGFYDVSQLAEVYGIDEKRYQALAPWFIADTLHVRQLEVNALPAAALRKHPYLDYRQAKAIEQLRKQKSRLSGWENLQLIEEFTDTDKKRLTPYLSFK